jgi:hypothetical protein
MKCYRQVSGLTLGPNANVDGWDRQWFVLGEVITEKSSDHHASDLLAWFAQRGNTAADFICITGQDSNSVQPDKNHHVNFKNRGINVIKANNGKVLTVPWRYAMVNACLETANRTRHLFIDCDDKGRSSAPKTFDSFEQLMLNSSDRAESHGKGSHGEDLTHFTDNVGYALWRFERHRGAPITEQARALWG